MSEEEELIKAAEELERAADSGESKEVDKKTKALASRVLRHIEGQRDDPVAQREALVRLAKARPISRMLKESGLIAIKEDENIGRTIIQLRGDDELVDRMQRANSAEILRSPDAPFLRVFRAHD